MDEDGDFICIDSDDELHVALTEVGSALLRMEIRRKNQSTKNTINLPCQFMTQLRRLVDKEDGKEMETVVHQRQHLVGIQKVMQKWPGVIFLGGDTAMEIVGKGVKQKNLNKEGQEKGDILVKRIMHGKRVENIINARVTDKNVSDEKRISVIFVPFLPERKKLHCHVFGSMTDFEAPCVAFKIRGNQPDGQKQDKGKSQKMVIQQSATVQKRGGQEKGTKFVIGSQNQKNQVHGIGGKQGARFRDVPRRRAKVLTSTLLRKLKDSNIGEKTETCVESEEIMEEEAKIDLEIVLKTARGDLKDTNSALA